MSFELCFARLFLMSFNPSRANPPKWSNTLKQFVRNLPTNCSSVFDHFVKLALKGLSFGSAIVVFSEQIVQCHPKGFFELE